MPSRTKRTVDETAAAASEPTALDHLQAAERALRTQAETADADAYAYRYIAERVAHWIEQLRKLEQNV